jgi:predicted Zn-dependent protease
MPEWLSTHPNPENREEAILRMADTAHVEANPPRVGHEAYLDHLDGLVFGKNPREGYFLGSRFYHPDLRFQMDFPSGWATANLKEAVQAKSPQEDAVMALTVEEAAVPSAALRTFLSQDGMQGSGLSEGALNGLPSASADFVYVSGQDRVDGRVLYLEHDGNVFRLLAYGTPSAWPGYRGALRDALTSFRPLSDATYLDVQPARIQVVSVPSTMTLEQFLSRRNAQDRAEEVRLLNRLEGDPTLRAGQLLKVPAGGRLPGVP